MGCEKKKGKKVRNMTLRWSHDSWIFILQAGVSICSFFSHVLLTLCTIKQSSYILDCQDIPLWYSMTHGNPLEIFGGLVIPGLKPKSAMLPSAILLQPLNLRLLQTHLQWSINNDILSFFNGRWNYVIFCNVDETGKYSKKRDSCLPFLYVFTIFIIIYIHVPYNFWLSFSWFPYSIG